MSKNLHLLHVFSLDYLWYCCSCALIITNDNCKSIVRLRILLNQYSVQFGVWTFYDISTFFCQITYTENLVYDQSIIYSIVATKLVF